MTLGADGPLLRVQALSFSYPRRHVFTHWSADFAAGITWLRGANGSGKSTLLKLLAGALPMLTGEISVAGIDALAQPIPYRREVFWCGPGHIAFDHLRAPEYFGILRSLYPRLDTAALDAHIAGFGLAPFLATRLAALSTGTQRKVWLSAALSIGASVVLMDEPFNALDAASLAHLQRSLAAHAGDSGRAWIVASHEPVVAATHVLDLVSA